MCKYYFSPDMIARHDWLSISDWLSSNPLYYPSGFFLFSSSAIDSAPCKSKFSCSLAIYFSSLIKFRSSAPDFWSFLKLGRNFLRYRRAALLWSTFNLSIFESYCFISPSCSLTRILLIYFWYFTKLYLGFPNWSPPDLRAISIISLWTLLVLYWSRIKSSN